VRLTVGKEGTRLDHLVAQGAGCSRAEARRLIDAGLVRVDGRKAHKGTLLSHGAQVELERGPHSDDERRPVPQKELPLDVLLADDVLIAINKPPGMPTHPLKPGEKGTLASALVARYPECALVADDPREGGVAHRLDIDTSGVLLAARSRDAWLALRRAFSTGAVEKTYLALCAGAPPDEGEVRAALAHAGRRVRATSEWDDDADPGARAAITRYRVVARTEDVALVRAYASTGRMHQIRAHLAHAGFPLVGDTLYGGPDALPGTHGHFLHALSVKLPHPKTNAPLEIEAPMPPARRESLGRLFLGMPEGID
jgi:23S rRNA pseudouridine1911/1915/1917 synthase